jgi:hypothetical protein
MKPVFLSVVAFAIATGGALAQSGGTVAVLSPSETTTIQAIEPASATTVQSFTFDLDRTADASLAPLPADAGDYGVASPSEVQQLRSITFDLD